MLLWNALLPSLFKFPKINYIESVGLIVLARLIFGGISFRHHQAQPKKYKDQSNRLLGLGWLDNIRDWKHYDKYWEEEGEQSFKNYKMRMKNDNSRNTDSIDNE